MKEYLDVVDEEGRPTGEVVERSIAHRDGIRHRTAHLWVIRDRGEGIEVLLQKRSEDKDSYPGCWYISSAGHIPAGEDYVESAIRELKEELGLDARPEELIFCGDLKRYDEVEFHGSLFKNDQVSRTFYMVRDVELDELTLQTSEVSEACWMRLDECRRRVKENSFPHCIDQEDLDVLPDRIPDKKE